MGSPFPLRRWVGNCQVAPANSLLPLLGGSVLPFLLAVCRDLPVTLKLAEIAADFQFVAALFASPLIFNSVYALTKQNPETLGDFLLAYQNGFFWQTVLAGVAGTMAARGRTGVRNS